MPPVDKRLFYSDPAVAESYALTRFGRRGGLRVAHAECAAVRPFLEGCPEGPLLDLACGPGTISGMLGSRWSGRLVLCDWSRAMLRAAGASSHTPRVRAEAARLPFRSGSFAGLLTLRFLFHYAEWAPFAREVFRVLRPGGVWVFDHLGWSPRRLLPAGGPAMGGRLYSHPPREVERVCRESGFGGAVPVAHLYAAPGWLYSRLPEAIAGRLLELERRWPDAWKTRHYYRATR